MLLADRRKLRKELTQYRKDHLCIFSLLLASKTCNVSRWWILVLQEANRELKEWRRRSASEPLAGSTVDQYRKHLESRFELGKVSASIPPQIQHS